MSDHHIVFSAQPTMNLPVLSVAGDFMCQKDAGGGRTVSRLDPAHAEGSGCKKHS